MQVITEQLTEYHKGHKLRGAALNSAVQADIRRVQKNRNVSIDATDSLSLVFIWSESPEGHDYWHDRCHGGA